MIVHASMQYGLRCFSLAATLVLSGSSLAADDVMVGAWGGAEAVITSENGADSAAFAWGGLFQYRASPSVAVELRIGTRTYDTIVGGGPSSTDFSYRQVPIAIGVKVLAASRSPSSFTFGGGLVLAPTRATKTEFFRPFPHPVQPRVSETTALALGGYLALGGDLWLGKGLVLIIDGRLVYQTAPASGDSGVVIPIGSVGLAYRF
jgi:hypothetical protein